MNGQFLGFNGTSWTNLSPPTAVPAKLTLAFSKDGTVATQIGAHAWTADANYTITQVRARVGTAPAGASLIVDVNKNGTTIFSTQSNRPTIAAATTTDLADAINVTSLSSGDFLTTDVDQVGSTTAGSNLVVQIMLQVV